MTNFFQAVLSYLEIVFNFVKNIIGALSRVFVILFESLSLPQVLAGYCFPILGSSVIIVSSIAILKLIIGR